MKRDTPDYILELCRNLRKKQTNAEGILWQHIRNRKLEGYKFRRQFPIGRYIADFYCNKARLVIEIDGDIHKRADKIEYDKIRQEEIEARNITVIRFSNEDITNCLEIVIGTLTRVLNSLSLSQPEKSP